MLEGFKNGASSVDFSRIAAENYIHNGLIKVEAGHPATENLLKIANSLSFDSFSLLDLALPWLSRSRHVAVYLFIEPQTGHPYLGA